jgi:hypothetical protein
MWKKYGKLAVNMMVRQKGTVNRMELVTLNKEHWLQDGNLVCHVQHVSHVCNSMKLINKIAFSMHQFPSVGWSSNKNHLPFR